MPILKKFLALKDYDQSNMYERTINAHKAASSTHLYEHPKFNP